MTRRLRISRRQVSLFPTRPSSDEAKTVDPKRELIEALADLLLEALGYETSVEGGDDESEDHS
jgi:hypothetical protein